MRFLSFIFTLFFTLGTFAFNPSDMRSFGADSTVQLYLFTSLTCSHCADFHKKILPQLKKLYADSGKAQIIIVDMITGKTGLIATQVLRCLEGEKANKFETNLYSNQSKWAFKDIQSAEKVIASYAAGQGMDEKQFEQCVADSELQKSIIEQQVNMARLYGVTGTPTLIMREGSEVRKWVGADKKIFKELKEAFAK